VKLTELGIDDPPLPSDPHLQKRRAALDLRDLFEMLGSRLASPVIQLKKKSMTLLELAEWCFSNQE
jgi:hypothetical protein